jgi:hypothetical protein
MRIDENDEGMVFQKGSDLGGTAETATRNTRQLIKTFRMS